MDIFTIQKNVVIPTPQALLIPAFKAIWDRDTSTKKNRAILEFSYIEFMLSPRKTNPFNGHTEEEKPGKIRAIIKLPSTWRPDLLVQEGLRVYDTIQSEGSQSYRYYQAVKAGLDKLIGFYEDTLDFEKKTKTGAPLYKPKDITDAISKAAMNMNEIKKIREQVEKELYESSKTVKNREINEFEKVDTLDYNPRQSKYE